ncbi:shikimate kinase, partial [Faecalibaculum rodentium]
AAAGLSIPEIFRQEQEAGFRRRETEAARQAGLDTGQVIACGGGIIERPENLDLLHRNGIILWLKRDPALMVHEDADRPMLKQGFDSLYGRRAPVYASWADLTVTNDGSLQEGLEAVCRALGLQVDGPASSG